MAKFGEGDSRWIVEDRSDGRNVNNWHWVEKDITAWTKTQLQEFFDGLEVTEGNYRIKFLGLESFEGDVILNNRKKKMIPTYELNFSAKWTAEAEGTGESTSGMLQVPYLSEENHDEHPELRVTTSDSGAPAEAARQAVLSAAKTAVLPELRSLVHKIHCGGPQDSHPSGATSTAAHSNGDETKKKIKEVQQPSAPATKPAKSTPVSRAELHQTHKFYASPQDLYECFTVPQRMMAYTHSPATAEHRVGGKFSMFNGSVGGEYTALEPGKSVSMKWRFSNWGDDVYSKVQIQLSAPETGTTVLTLDQSSIPDEDKYGNEDVLANVERGWEDQIFRRIKAVFGYGI